MTCGMSRLHCVWCSVVNRQFRSRTKAPGGRSSRSQPLNQWTPLIWFHVRQPSHCSPDRQLTHHHHHHHHPGLSPWLWDIVVGSVTTIAALWNDSASSASAKAQKDFSLSSPPSSYLIVFEESVSLVKGMTKPDRIRSIAPFVETVRHRHTYSQLVHDQPSTTLHQASCPTNWLEPP